MTVASTVHLKSYEFVSHVLLPKNLPKKSGILFSLGSGKLPCACFDQVTFNL